MLSQVPHIKTSKGFLLWRVLMLAVIFLQTASNVKRDLHTSTLKFKTWWTADAQRLSTGPFIVKFFESMKISWN
jgi:hypothetical protein